MSKLVRDKVLDLLRAEGGNPVTHIADDQEYWKRLQAKLLEEVKELFNSKDDANFKEELADVIEVILAIQRFKNIDHGELFELCIKKEYEKGLFDKRIVLDKR